MLSSVPITLGGVQYSLSFTPEDVDLIESETDSSLLEVIMPKSMLRIGRIALLLNYGLKKAGEHGPHGEPLRAIPLTREGRIAAIEIIRQRLEGKPATELTALARTIIKAISTSWFIPMTDEAAASVPQAATPPKNSEGPGSRPSNQ